MAPSVGTPQVSRRCRRACVRVDRTGAARTIVVITQKIACGVCMRTGLLLPALVLVYRGMATLADAVEATDSSACQSQIYCEGPILHAVQMADIFNDSKVFVDLPLKFPHDIVLSNFATLNWNSPRTYPAPVCYGQLWANWQRSAALDTTRLGRNLSRRRKNPLRRTMR